MGYPGVVDSDDDIAFTIMLWRESESLPSAGYRGSITN